MICRDISPSQYQLISDPAGLGIFVEYWLPVHIDVAGDEPVGAGPHHHVLPPHRPVVLAGDVVGEEGGGRPLSAGQTRTPSGPVTTGETPVESTVMTRSRGVGGGKGELRNSEVKLRWVVVVGGLRGLP